MPYEIAPSNYAEVASLFEPLAAFNVSIEAVRDGNNWGYIMADAPHQPTAALMYTVEGTHLAGQPSAAFANEINAELHQYYFTEERRAIYVCASAGWLPHLAAALAPYPVQTQARYHYVCHNAPPANVATQLPDGYAVRAIDAAFLNDPTLAIPEHIHGWIEGNWGGVENYLRLGFGRCITHHNRVVSWSVCDCISGQRCEIGIQTDPDYRQHGLAAITTMACAHHALSSGFTEVGWHCAADNIGSWKTALKAGFVREREYQQFFVVAPDA